MKVAYFNIYRDPSDIREALQAYPDVDLAVAENAAELPVALDGAEVILVANRTYTEEPARAIREHGKYLRWIAFTTSGIDKARSNGLPDGVIVTNMAGLRAFAVAEHAVFLMLALVRSSRANERAQQAPDWARIPMTPLMDNLAGKHLVIAGMGAIGQEIARKAKAFDMRVTGVSRGSAAPEHVDRMASRAELEALAADADILLAAAEANEDTFGIISRAVIDAMQPHAYFVNIARGSLVDEPALIDALRERRLAGAGLDVQEQEPVPPDHPLWLLDNVILTPHLGGSGSGGLGVTCASLFTRNLDLWIAGKPLEQIVLRT